MSSEPGALRVLAFCDHFPGTSGGAERVALETYRRFPEEADVLVVTAGEARRVERGAAAGVRYVRFPSRDLSGALGAQVSAAPSLLFGLRRLVEDFSPSVLHAHSLHFQTSLAAAVVAGRHGVPLVTTVHVGAIDRLAAFTRRATVVYEATLGRFVLSRSTGVVAVSDAVARHVSRLRPRSVSSVTVVPNGVDRSLFRPAPRAARGVPHIVFLGRLISNKGPDILLDALEVLDGRGREYTAELLGDGPLRGRLEERVRASRVGRVRLRGAVSDAAPRLAEADIVVRPSLTEGMSLAVLEAMSAGACVVVSDIEENAALVDHGRDGLLFRCGDPGSLADTLDAALADQHLRRRLGRAARRRTSAFSWGVCAADTFDVLARCASTGEARCAS